MVLPVTSRFTWGFFHTRDCQITSQLESRAPSFQGKHQVSDLGAFDPRNNLSSVLSSPHWQQNVLGWYLIFRYCIPDNLPSSRHSTDPEASFSLERSQWKFFDLSALVSAAGINALLKAAWRRKGFLVNEYRAWLIEVRAGPQDSNLEAGAKKRSWRNDAYYLAFFGLLSQFYTVQAHLPEKNSIAYSGRYPSTSVNN